MIGWVLFVTITGVGSGVYSGDDYGVPTNRPHVFKTEQACLKLRDAQVKIFHAERVKKPQLPPFKLECLPADQVIK